MNTLKDKNPCYGCTDRTPGCHPTCQAYLTWKADLDERNAKIYSEQYKDRELVLKKFDGINVMARKDVGKKPGYRIGK